MQYKNSFLTNVILRIDFAFPIEELKSDLSSTVKECSVEYFPIFEPKERNEQKFEFSSAESKHNISYSNNKFLEWHFVGADRDKELCINPSFMFIDIRHYHSFEDLKSQFLSVLECLKNEYPEIIINRIGLRYINQIKIDDERIAGVNWYSFWEQYINSNLLWGLKFVDDKCLARHMNSIHYKYDNYLQHFQYGIFNEDYPAINKKKTYILDYDTFASGKIETIDVESLIDEFYSKSIMQFENSITDKLREKMEIVDG